MTDSKIGAVILFFLFVGFSILITPSVFSTIIAETIPGDFIRVAGPWLWILVIFAQIVAAIYAVTKL